MQKNKRRPISARPATPEATEMPTTAGVLRREGLVEDEVAADAADAADVVELRELKVGVVVEIVNEVELARELEAKLVVFAAEGVVEAVGSGHDRELGVGVIEIVLVVMMVAVIVPWVIGRAPDTESHI